MQRTISSINKFFLVALAIIAFSSGYTQAQTESTDPQPLTLNEAIRLALENNNDIRRVCAWRRLVGDLACAGRARGVEFLVSFHRLDESAQDADRSVGRTDHVRQNS